MCGGRSSADVSDGAEIGFARAHARRRAVALKRSEPALALRILGCHCQTWSDHSFAPTRRLGALQCAPPGMYPCRPGIRVNRYARSSCRSLVSDQRRYRNIDRQHVGALSPEPLTEAMRCAVCVDTRCGAHWSAPRRRDGAQEHYLGGWRCGPTIRSARAASGAFQRDCATRCVSMHAARLFVLTNISRSSSRPACPRE